MPALASDAKISWGSNIEISMNRDSGFFTCGSDILSQKMSPNDSAEKRWTRYSDVLASSWFETRCLKKLHGITFLHRCLQAQALRRPWRFQPCESWNESARVSKDSLGIVFRLVTFNMNKHSVDFKVQTGSGTKKDGIFNNFCVILLIASMLAWKHIINQLFKYTCNQRFFPAFPLVNSWKISWTSSDAAVPACMAEDILVLHDHLWRRSRSQLFSLRFLPQME